MSWALQVHLPSLITSRPSSTHCYFLIPGPQYHTRVWMDIFWDIPFVTSTKRGSEPITSVHDYSTVMWWFDCCDLGFPLLEVQMRLYVMKVHLVLLFHVAEIEFETRDLSGGMSAT